MKLPALVLVGSLAANAALLALFAYQPALAPPAVRDWFVSDADQAAQRADALRLQRERADADLRAEADKRAGVWSTLQAEDLRTLIARLKAAGFSPVLVRAIVNARLEATFSARMQELIGTVGDAPFWKPEPFSSYSNAKFYETQSQIYRDRTKALRELLGDDFYAAGSGDPTADQRRQFGDLPKAKIDLIQRIVDDYAEMESQVRAATNGIALPEDRAKLALLARERRTDLAAILTPAELEDYEMRTSTITSRLRTGLTLMDATEAEFQAIYRAQQPFADLLNPPSIGGSIRFTAEDSRLRTEAQNKINDQIKAALGEQRYADYARASNYDYQNLHRLAQRDNIPVEAINRAYDLRLPAAQESMRIHDARLDPAARNAALQALAATTKAKLVANLGPAVAEDYAKNLSWLNALERGYSLRLSPDGRTTTYMAGPTAPKR
ncbi:MAG: hypothetical protein JNK23_01105 [Opitutaceae bacterium]|nr:hypothetical protein [Opitutaceae bacterium]